MKTSNQLPLLSDLSGNEPTPVTIIQTMTDAPVNCMTNNVYDGKNKLELMQQATAKGYKRNIWGTFHQWMSQGFVVRKGEHGVTIFCGFYERKDSNKKVPKYARVFNIHQVEATNL